jgi:hypothetical protein
MTTSARRPTTGPAFSARGLDVAISDDYLAVQLEDGRRIEVPLAWFPRLVQASPEQRKNWRLIGRGVGIHWPDLDEDISVANLLGSDGKLLMHQDEPSPAPPTKVGKVVRGPDRMIASRAHN